MELKEFIEETLRQIIEGVAAAQGGELGGHVNASQPGMGPNGNLMNGGTYGVFTRVDFDVAVIAESSVSGKAGLKVWSVGAEAGGGQKSSSTSRIAFSVPVRLPDGDQAKLDEEQQK